MLEAKQFELDVRPRETAWALDPDVDPEASDFNEWMKTGEGLVARPHGKIAVIKWRPLTLTEQGAIFSDLAQNSTGEYGMLLLCVRHGLLSCEGLKIESKDYPEGRRVKPECAARFEMLGGEVPGIGKVSPVMWLGGLIAAASFRDGG